VFIDATRAGGATIAAAYSPRARPGVLVSMPVAWEAIDDVDPRDYTIRTVPILLDGADPWRDLMPAGQTLDAGLIAQGRTIPVARVAAMHAGRRRASAARAKAGGHE
jgi:DNA primase